MYIFWLVSYSLRYLRGPLWLPSTPGVTWGCVYNPQMILHPLWNLNYDKSLLFLHNPLPFWFAIPFAFCYFPFSSPNPKSISNGWSVRFISISLKASAQTRYADLNIARWRVASGVPEGGWHYLKKISCNYIKLKNPIKYYSTGSKYGELGKFVCRLIFLILAPLYI